MQISEKKEKKKKNVLAVCICILISIVYTCPPTSKKKIVFVGAKQFLMLCSQLLWKFQFLGNLLYWEYLISLLGERARSFSFIKPSLTNYANYYVNSRIVDSKRVCFLLVCWFFSLLLWNFLFENSVCSTIHWNFQKGFHCCLLRTLWNCEYCLIWALNKSILFGSNSPKVSL